MKQITISIIISIAIVAVAIVFVRTDTEKNVDTVYQSENVSIDTSGTQVITIGAKGGYNPQYTRAQANTQTKIIVHTQGTFDCSATLNIPAISYSQTLTPTGETHIDVPPQESGSVLSGVCGMGMYNFKIRFE